MNVLVLDLTHGGDVLALTYRSRGEEVTAVDVYGTAEQYMIDHLRNEGSGRRENHPLEEI